MPGSGYFKTSYFDDMRLVDTPLRLFWVMVLCLGLILFPFFSSSYYIHLINLALINAIVALGLNILTGRAGVISLGHAGIFAAGSYAVAILGMQQNVPFLLVLPATVAVGAIFGLVMGLPSLRLRALYIVLGTMAMHYILVYIGKKYQSLAGYHWGISIPDPSIGPFVLNSTIKWYPVLIIIVWLATIFCINLLRSRVGRAWTAIGDRDFVALALGIHVGYYKILAFVFASALVALGGGLSAYYTHFVTAETYTISLGLTFVAMILIGGLGSITGSFLGALFVIILPYALSGIFEILPLPLIFEARRASIELILFGFFIILFLIVEPKGLAGIWKMIRDYFVLWPFRYRRSVITR